jgi:hypothetical protein
MTWRCWRDRKGIKHLLDGMDIKWCDQSAAAPTHRPNADSTPTCLRCMGEWMRHQ